MAVLNFPTSPTLNQTYTENGSTWKWNGVGWLVQPDPLITDLGEKILRADDAGTVRSLLEL